MTTLDRKQLLIHGFIREIENLLQNDQIIPNGLIQICFLFYSVSFKLFISTESNLYIADIDKQTVSNLVNTKKVNINKRLATSCYIPDISQYIPLHNKQYDGIIGIYQNDTFMNHPYHPFVALFESNKIEDDNIEYNLYVPSNCKAVPNSIEMSVIRPHLINCSEHGVMYASQGIHQLKWENMDFESGKFNFNTIQCSIDAIDESFGSVAYIHNEHKLFVMEGYTMSDLFRFNDNIYIYNDSNTTIQQKQCAIFDLSTNEWIEIKEFQFPTNGIDTVFNPGICERNEYDVNGVYIVSNIGHVGKYDMNKNEWEMLLDDMNNEEIQFRLKPIVWMNDNPHILYCHSVSLGSYFGCFDMRNNKKRWNTNNEMQFILDRTCKQNANYAFIFV